MRLSRKEQLVILGSTGNVGSSAVEIIEKNLDRFAVHTLVCHSNKDKMLKQLVKFPKAKGIVLNEDEHDLLVDVVQKEEVDTVFVACSSIELLDVLIAAIRAKKKIIMANKELIVCFGEQIMREIRKHKTLFVPVDSEHCGIFQALHSPKVLDEKVSENINKITLTCSGGPFWNRSHEQLKKITPEQALKHPVWKMGNEITLNSATHMNKAFEIIEAKYLFNLDVSQIDVLIHPAAYIHAIVHFNDGNILLHGAYPDMKIPISYGLRYPDLAKGLQCELDLEFYGKNLEFHKPDLKKFPSIQFAYDAIKKGGDAPRKLYEASKEANKKFINKEISFPEIFDFISCRVS